MSWAGAVLAIVFRDNDQGVLGVWTCRYSLDQSANSEIIISLLRLGRVYSSQRRSETAHVVVANADQRKARQVAVGDELIKLALPFVIAPHVRIVLIVAAEVQIGQRSERWIKRRDLHDSRGEGIGYRSRFCANASDVVHQESVIADSPTSLSHRVENVAILYTERRIGRCVVAGAGQHVGRATGKSRCRRWVKGCAEGSGRGSSSYDRGVV